MNTHSNLGDAARHWTKTNLEKGLRSKDIGKHVIPHSRGNPRLYEGGGTSFKIIGGTGKSKPAGTEVETERHDS